MQELVPVCSQPLPQNVKVNNQTAPFHICLKNHHLQVKYIEEEKMTRKQTSELWQEGPQIAKAFQVGNYSLNIFYGFLSTFPPKSILRTISRRRSRIW